MRQSAVSLSRKALSTEPLPEKTWPLRKQNLVADIIAEVETVGPDVPEIARRLGIPPGTVRRCFRSKIVKNDYKLLASVSLGSLGLRPIEAVVDIPTFYATYANDVFAGMDDHWFLHEYYRTLPDGRFLITFMIPKEHYEEFPRLLEGMKEAGFIEKVHRVYRPEWRAYKRLQADRFDFTAGRWEVDWTHLPQGEASRPRLDEARDDLDSTDVAILIGLQVDASRSVTEIASRTRTDPDIVRRRLAGIRAKGLVECYRLIWMKNQMDQDAYEPYRRPHRFAGLILNVPEVSDEEQEELSRKLNSLPFLRLEYGGNDYGAYLGFPIDQMMETLSYLREVVEPVRDRASWVITDPRCSLVYTIPRLFDDSRRRWVFDVKAQVDCLKEQLRTVRSERRAKD